MERIKRSETIGYKVRLLHNQIHKNMEAKRMENEDNLTRNAALDTWFFERSQRL